MKGKKRNIFRTHELLYPGLVVCEKQDDEHGKRILVIEKQGKNDYVYAEEFVKWLYEPIR